ncbi:MAG: L7Ae/L30e/S12e/Gadd45 family ribosomal protein [Christensenellales bacterium]
MNENRIKTMIGFAARAGQCALGATAVEAAIRSKKAKLVLLDKESTENTKKNYQNLCRHYKIPYVECTDPGSAAGKPGRLSLAILRQDFAEQILKA